MKAAFRNTPGEGNCHPPQAPVGWHLRESGPSVALRRFLFAPLRTALVVCDVQQVDGLEAPSFVLFDGLCCAESCAALGDGMLHREQPTHLWY